MKKKLSLLLVMVMALTMVLGTGVCAWANDNPNAVDAVCYGENNHEGVNHFYFTGQIDTVTNACYGYVYSYNSFGGGHYIFSEVGPSTPVPITTDKFAGGYPTNGAGWYYAESPDFGMVTWYSCNGTHITAPGQTPKAVAPCANPVLEQPVYVAAPHVHEWVEGVIYDATADADGLEGVYCKTCGAIRESSPISAYSYTLEKYALEKINASKPGQTIIFEFGELNSFPKSFMEKLVAKSAQGVTFVFKYKVNHELQTITIPAGTHINLDFDWYGYAKMAELYGMY